MKTLISLGLFALVAPGFVLAGGSRESQGHDEASEKAKEHHETMQQAQQEHGAQDMLMSRRPTDGYHAGEIIGQNLKFRSDDEDIGSIRDLIIDQDGQIVAVVVGVGGFLGIGEKDVAIAWDQVTRSVPESGDGYHFHVDTTESALRDAPEYQREHNESAQAREQRHETEQEQRRVTAAEREQEQHVDQAVPFSDMPSGGFHADELIGRSLSSRSDGRKIGTIDDLILDRDGRLVAVLVGTGGFLGLGEKNVAIAWDAVERTIDDEGEYVFHVDATARSLRDAPEYDND